MSAAFYARFVFGVSAVMYGIVSLLWHDSDLWVRLHALAYPLAIALVIGGLTSMAPRVSRGGYALLGVAFGVFTVTSTSYVDFFEYLSIACGAFVMYPAKFDPIVRIAFAICVFSFAGAQIEYLTYTASLVPVWLWPNAVLWTNLTTAAFVLAAFAILINRFSLRALRLLALMIALFGVLVWIPKIATHPWALSNWSELAMNYLIAASSLLVEKAAR